MIPANTVEYWASLGRLKQVREAVSDGHDVNAVGVDGYTALHAAAENSHTEVVRFLLANGADVGARLDTGETAADMASDPVVVNLLREAEQSR